jgi:hypothetical protein
LPGNHNPVFAPDELAKTKPDYMMILPWNLKRKQLAYTRSWGGRFVVPIREVSII